MQKEIKVLVVDDEEIMRKLFTDILQEEGCKVTCVSNGKEAVDRIKDEFFDLAFIDLHMPVMDGVQTFYMLRKVTPKTVLVMMDSMPIYGIEKFKEMGAATHIHKPFDIS